MKKQLANGLKNMVNNFYQNKIQSTVDKTKNIFEEVQAIPIATLTALFGTIIVMILFNSSYSIFNSDIDLETLAVGNALIGFLIFSIFFTFITSIVVACIFLIIIAPPTKKQLIEIKDACVDYTRIFRELRVQRYELDEDRLTKVFDSSLERMMKNYGIKSLKEIGIFLTKAHNLIENQNKIITKQSKEIKNLKSRVESLEKDKKEDEQFFNEKTHTQNIEHE